MATLATSYLNARNEVPGANTTNMPDATMLPEAKSIYVWLFQTYSPRVQNYAGGTFGWVTTAASQRIINSVSTTIARIEVVRYETSANGTDGVPLHYLTKAQFELERQTYPGSNAAQARCAHWYRDEASGAWVLMLHPPSDAAGNYYSFEGEVEPNVLTSGASTLLIGPHLIAIMDKLLARWVAQKLGKDAAFIEEITKRVPDQTIAAAWLAREESRGEMVKGEARGRL